MMRHPSEGTLQAYVDGALDLDRAAQVRAHLRQCSQCTSAVAEIEARSKRVGTWIESLNPNSTPQSGTVRSVQALRRRLDAYEAEKEEVTMPWLNPKRFLGRRSGVVGLAVMALLVLALSFTLPPVRAFAGDLLALFRVREIEVVEFSPSTLFNVEGAEATMQSLERVMDEQVTVETDGEAQAVDEATLRSLSWGPVRLPQPGEDAAYYALQPGAHLTVQVDLPRIQALLQELGYRDVALPATLDGSLVTVDLMPAAIAAYGDCERAAAVRDAGEGPPQLDGRCTVLMQMQSPVVTAPDGLDVQQLGQAYLQLLGLSATEAARFSERIDWTSTLVVPLPRSEVTYEDVRVDGVSGVLIRPTQHRLAQSEYLLMWVKGDIIYTLTGRGSTAEAQQVANSLQ